MRRLLVAGLLVLAGCGGLGGGTPTPAPTAPAETTAGADAFVAPGVTREGIADPDALARAHGAAVEGRSYVLASERVARYPNGTLRSRLTVRVALGADHGYRATASTAGPEAPTFLGDPPATGTFWSNGTTYARRFTHGERTVYNEFEPRQNGAGTWSYWVRTVPFGGRQSDPVSFYRAVFWSARSWSVERRPANGTAAYRLVATGTTESGFDPDVTRLRTARLVADVAPSGLVRTLSLRYAGESAGAPVRVRWTVRYRGVGSTAVARPPWLGRALAQSSPNASANRSASRSGRRRPSSASTRSPSANARVVGAASTP